VAMLPPAETFVGRYFYHIEDISGFGFNLCAVKMNLGPNAAINPSLAECCDEFYFCNPWGRSGSPNIIWGDDWYERRDIETIPSTTALGMNYPNPFNAATVIPFDLATSGNVSLKVYNLSGQVVETLLDEYMDAGHHTAQWDASGSASGLYFCRLQAGDFVTTTKMNLLK